MVTFKRDKKSLDPDYPGKKEVKKEVTRREDGTPSKEVYKFPTEIVDLPSKGLVYPEDNPLSGGRVEMKYMSAKEEDILTSQNLIQKGVVIDKLLQSLIVSDIDYNDLIIGDKNALMIAARVYGYGKDYPSTVTCPKCGNVEDTLIDLTLLKVHVLADEVYNRENKYEFELPLSKKTLGFKLLTHADENKINDELRHMKDFHKKSGKKDATSNEFTTRLKYVITSVDGDLTTKAIRGFVDNQLLSKDSLAFRTHLKELSPDVDMVFEYNCAECGGVTDMGVPMTVEFFWPEA